MSFLQKPEQRIKGFPFSGAFHKWVTAGLAILTALQYKVVTEGLPNMLMLLNILTFQVSWIYQ